MTDCPPMSKGGFVPLTYEASLPPPLWRAGALEAADHVLAGSSVLTRVGQTCLLRWGGQNTAIFFLFFFSETHLCTIYNTPKAPKGQASVLSQLATLSSYYHSLIYRLEAWSRQ